MPARMSKTLSDTEVDRLLKGIEIPPCPAILTRLSELILSPTASMGAIANVISKDVALSAAVIKTANSPLLGLSRKVESVSQAVNLLGMTMVINLVMGELLRSSLSKGSAMRADRFWDTSGKIAAVCARLSKRFMGISPDQAYTFGLFHDCGIPVLMRRFPDDYRETLQQANASLNENFVDIEDARHATNHAVIGYLLTRNWGLPEQTCHAVQRHHDPQIFSSEADNETAGLRTLVSLVILAEYLVAFSTNMKEDVEWLRWKSAVMAHLGLDDSDLYDLQDEILQTLDSNSL